ncbi:unnamed protein product [Pleuronectes platessa]|uniref:Uncharacterized protein n=1 Tax=Pleuronectes platessa TaxID=8262 RepID=A0A9N7URU0_PLEPL|nr:unnamed protein product [Pleuronectes platessa]
MPIASGAAGRVDVGGEASTTWSPDGLKRKPRAANKSWDSYLQRYKELNKRNKGNVPQVTQDSTEQSIHENEGDTDESPMTNGGSGGHASEEPSSGENSKKSQMCVLL